MCLLMLVVDETYSRIILHFLHFTLFLFSLSSRKWLHTLDRLLHPIHPFLILYSFTASTKSSSISEKGSENKKYHKNISSAAFHNEDQPLGWDKGISWAINIFLFTLSTIKPCFMWVCPILNFTTDGNSLLCLHTESSLQILQIIVHMGYLEASLLSNATV